MVSTFGTWDTSWLSLADGALPRPGWGGTRGGEEGEWAGPYPSVSEAPPRGQREAQGVAVLLAGPFPDPCSLWPPSGPVCGPPELRQRQSACHAW